MSTPPSGRFARFRKLASLSVSLGGDALKKSAQRLLGQDEELLGKSAAEKVAATLGDMKGLAMKLGQAISMEADLLTPEVRAVLSRLQNQAPPMPYETVQEVVTTELGAPISRLFSSFEETPRAAASLGQVHFAVLPDGREVAVKVQYPGIGEALSSDLENLGLVVGTLSRTSKLLDGRRYYEELREQMEYELNYVLEAERASAFAEAIRPFSDLKVPLVVPSHTSKKVLTMEWLQGKVLKDFLAENPENDERFRVTRLLIRAIYGPFLFAGQMHADPHPGNFMVLPDGRMGILDFGSIKQFSTAFAGANRKIFQCAIENRRVDVVSVLRELGTTFDLPEEVADALIWELLQLIGRPLNVDSYDFSKDKIVQDAQKFFKDNALKMLKLRPPPEAVMFFRATGGLQQNLRLLGAQGDFKAVYQQMGEDVRVALV